MERTTPDLIELDVPLDPRHASTVRALAASVAADAGLSVDEIEDFRLGVNEAVALLADAEPEPDARLHLTFRVEGRFLSAVAARRGNLPPFTEADVDQLAGRILTAVLDDFRVEDGKLVVEKRAARDEP